MLLGELCKPPWAIPSALTAAEERGGSLVYRYGEDELNRTEEVEEKPSGDEDSRDSNSVSVWTQSQGAGAG